MGPGADDDILARAQARVGMLLRGKYRIDGVLGVGGMAVVYAATHRNKKRFAVKVLHPELSFRADLRARFLREGYAANSVEHPGTVAVLDDDVAEDGGAFLVMELLEGETVEERWERSGQRLPLDAVLAIGYELLDVLAAAHARGVVHRDIKPANLFLTRGGGLKVLDFGIARLRDIAASQATQMGALMGTPSYMAPEQARGITDETDGVDAQTDVWAAGATLFTLASGRMVHEGGAVQAVIFKAATQPAPSLADVLPGAPGSVVHAVDRALAFDKAQRWPGADAMRDALREASVACFGRIPSLPPPGAGPSPRVPTLSSQPGPPSAPPPVATAYVAAPPRPLTTAPVSSDPGPALPVPGLPDRRQVRVTIAAGIGAAALGVLLVATLVPRPHPGTGNESEGGIASGAAGGGTNRSGGGGESAGAGGNAGAGAGGSESRGGSEGATGGATDAGPVTGSHAVRSFSTATATTTATQTVTATTHKLDCNPNFYLDKDGEKHFKPECFQLHQ